VSVCVCVINTCSQDCSTSATSHEEIPRKMANGRGGREVNDASNLLLVISVIVMCACVCVCVNVRMCVVSLCICLCCVRANIPRRTTSTAPHGTSPSPPLQTHTHTPTHTQHTYKLYRWHTNLSGIKEGRIRFRFCVASLCCTKSCNLCSEKKIKK